jgi:hypothetical protein
LAQYPPALIMRCCRSLTSFASGCLGIVDYIRIERPPPHHEGLSLARSET